MESVPDNNVTGASEYFLGLCDIDTLTQWDWCGRALEKQRPKECAGFEDMARSRVHRRLCDINSIAYYAKNCDCSVSLGHDKLYEVTGKNDFPVH